MFGFSSFRVVGGLLSAYDLSGDGVFLEKAKDIADRLLPAWDTSSGIPYNRINLARGQAHNPGWTRVCYQCLFSYNLMLGFICHAITYSFDHCLCFFALNIQQFSIQF